MTKYTAQSSIGKNFPFYCFSRPPVYVSVRYPPSIFGLPSLTKSLLTNLDFFLIFQLVVWAPSYSHEHKSEKGCWCNNGFHGGTEEPILSCLISVQMYYLHLVMDCCWAHLNLWCDETDRIQFIKSAFEHTVIWYPMAEHFISTSAQKNAKGYLSKTIHLCYRWHRLISESQEPVLWLSH